jgi:1-deoxy-D-xylulose-5-phosphate reductoisomerase
MSTPKRVAVLGSTGSIGTSTMKVARDLPHLVQIRTLAAGRNCELLAQQIAEFQPALAVCSDTADLPRLRSLAPPGAQIDAGPEAIIRAATHPEVDIVLVAIVGTAGLLPALAAIRAGKDLAIASKEILVLAGEIVTREARRHNVRLLPVDSEHNAIFQCLEGRDPATIKRLILTASGGPFRATPAAELEHVTPEQALRHPTWSMGRKITTDSATMFNKALEMIEARWLFDMPIDRVDVVIHPQSIVHSMIETVDGSVLAQLSVTDMAFPIQYALTYPLRVSNSLPPLDWHTIGSLTFEAPDEKKFPALRLAREAGRAGGTLPAVLNAANEVAVEAFFQRKISFPAIWRIVEQIMLAHNTIPHPDLDQLIAADAEARAKTNETIARFA